MKEIKRYICGYCGRKYKEKKQCRKCEEQHKKPTGIVGAIYVDSEDEYPFKMDIMMENGTMVRYTKERVIK